MTIIFPSLSPTERMYSLLLLYDFLPLHAIKSLLLGFQGTVMKEHFFFKRSILTHICREKRSFLCLRICGCIRQDTIKCKKYWYLLLLLFIISYCLLFAIKTIFRLDVWSGSISWWTSQFDLDGTDGLQATVDWVILLQSITNAWGCP